MRVIALLLLSLLFLECSKNIDDNMDSYSGPIQSVLLSNFTGHLIRQSRDYCGDGINVVFVVSTKYSTDSYLYEPDTYRQIPLKMKRGEQVNITAYEGSVNGNFLAQKTVTFNPPTESTSQARPEIVLCPKDQIRIYDFE